MFNKNNCYIYLEAKGGINHREGFRIIGFRISRTSFDSVPNTFKGKCVWLHF